MNDLQLYEQGLLDSHNATVSPDEDKLQHAIQRIECNADEGHPCDANNGDPCASCQAEHDYWRRQWETYGRAEVANQYSAEDIRDAYAHPTEHAKRDSLLRQIETNPHH